MLHFLYETSINLQTLNTQLKPLPPQTPAVRLSHHRIDEEETLTVKFIHGKKSVSVLVFYGAFSSAVRAIPAKLFTFYEFLSFFLFLFHRLLASVVELCPFDVRIGCNCGKGGCAFAGTGKTRRQEGERARYSACRSGSTMSLFVFYDALNGKW